VEKACANVGGLFFVWHLNYLGVSAPNIVRLCKPVQAVIDNFGGSTALEDITVEEWAGFLRGPVDSA
jgi:hypothetical protein